MHLAPLTGIETIKFFAITKVDAMHLAPLTGIETFLDFNSNLHLFDASRAPYGD